MNLTRCASVALVAITTLLTGCAAAGEDADPNALEEVGEGESVGEAGSGLTATCTISVGKPYASNDRVNATVTPKGCGKVTIQVSLYEGGAFVGSQTKTVSSAFTSAQLPASSVHEREMGWGTNTFTVVAIIGDPRSPARRASASANLFVGGG